MNKEIRYRTEQVPLTLGQRANIWWKGVVDAIHAKPETHWTRWIRVMEGELGYDSAPFVWAVDPHPMVFTFKDGEYKQVEPSEEITELNPNWHDE